MFIIAYHDDDVHVMYLIIVRKFSFTEYHVHRMRTEGKYANLSSKIRSVQQLINLHYAKN